MATCKYCDRKDLSGKELSAHEAWHAEKQHNKKQALTDEQKSAQDKKYAVRSFFTHDIKTSQGIIFTQENFLLACGYEAYNKHNLLSKLKDYFFGCRESAGGGRVISGEDGEAAVNEILSLYKQRSKAIGEM